MCVCCGGGFLGVRIEAREAFVERVWSFRRRVSVLSGVRGSSGVDWGVAR